MPREKMIPKAPAPDAPGRTPLERTADLTRRLLSVPKSELPTPKKKRKHR